MPIARARRLIDEPHENILERALMHLQVLEADRQLAEPAQQRGDALRFGRIEGYFDASDGRDDDEVGEIANDALIQARPVRRFGGRIIDTDGARYGIHWQCGDQVMAEFLGRRFKSIIRSVLVTVEPDREAIEARLEWASNE